MESKINRSAKQIQGLLANVTGRGKTPIFVSLPTSNAASNHSLLHKVIMNSHNYSPTPTNLPLRNRISFIFRSLLSIRFTNNVPAITQFSNRKYCTTSAQTKPPHVVLAPEQRECVTSVRLNLPEAQKKYFIVRQSIPAPILVSFLEHGHRCLQVRGIFCGDTSDARKLPVSASREMPDVCTLVGSCNVLFLRQHFLFASMEYLYTSPERVID